MTTATGARFKIESSPSTDAGYDATAGGTIDLQLEGSPALDVRSCVYDIRLPTKDAPSLTLPGGGIADPPTAIVTMSIPSGSYSFVVRCRTNGGELVTGANGKPDASVNTFERIVSVRSPLAGLRKIIVGERLEYASERGWTDAYAEMVDAIDGVAGGGFAEHVMLASIVAGVGAGVGTPTTIGERVVHEVTNASSITFVVNAERASGAGSVYVDLYDVGAASVISTATLSSAGLTEKLEDASALIGTGTRRLKARAYADGGSTIDVSYVGLRYSSAP